MKTIKKMTIVALVLVSTFSYAEKREHSNVKAFSKSVVVEFVDAKKGQKLVVKDPTGIILHSETVKTNGDLSKTFVFKKLKDGKYTIELEKDYEVIIKPFEIKNKILTFEQAKETKIFKPVVRKENDKLLVSQLSFNSKPVKVEIFYEDELIYSETIEGEKTVNRIYKLEGKKFGNYHTVIKTDNRSYTEKFKL